MTTSTRNTRAAAPSLAVVPAAPKKGAKAPPPPPAAKASPSGRKAPPPPPPAPLAVKGKAPPPPAPKRTGRALPAEAVVTPAAKGSEAQARAMLTAIGLPAADPRVALHGLIVRGRIFDHAKADGVTARSGPARVVYFLALPDDPGPLAAGLVALYWGTPSAPMAPADLAADPVKRARWKNAFDMSLDELSSLFKADLGPAAPAPARGPPSCPRRAPRPGAGASLPLDGGSLGAILTPP